MKHTIKFFFTASSGIPDFPRFMADLLVDDVELFTCYSNKTLVIKRDALKGLLDDNPRLLEYCTQNCFEKMPNLFQARLSDVMQHLNQSEGTVLFCYTYL